MTPDRLVAKGAEMSGVEGDFLHGMATSSSQHAPTGLIDSTFPFWELGCTFSYPYVPTR